MSLILYARLPDSSISRLALRPGQHARVGRSEWAELSLPGDELLADEHFLVKCSGKAAVESLPGSEIIFHGEPTPSLSLQEFPSTAVEFVAGNTTFAVHWTPEPNTPSERKCAVADPTQQRFSDESTAIRQLALQHSLSAEALALLGEPQDRQGFLDALVSAELMDDAIRFIAAAVEPQDAVAWALKEANDACEIPATTKIKRWITLPSDENRIAVKDAINESLHGPAPKTLHWLGQAVTYSGGSLAPDDQDVIAPPKQLVGVCVVTAVRWILNTCDDSVEVTGRLVAAGKQLMDDRKENGDAASS